MANTPFKTIDEYLNSCPKDIAAKMAEIKKIILENAPNATEKISWGMPTFYLKENLVHFFAHKNHIGFYPGAEGIEAFKEEFNRLGYKYSKGAVQFPINQEMPLDLIKNIVIFRVKEIMSGQN